MENAPSIPAGPGAVPETSFHDMRKGPPTGSPSLTPFSLPPQLLATCLLTSYGYFSEQFMSWYGGDPSERYTYTNRLIGFGQYAGVAWALVCCNVLAPQALWVTSVRRSPRWLFVLSLVVLVGMWLERYLIICQSLSRDYLPPGTSLRSASLMPACAVSTAASTGSTSRARAPSASACSSRSARGSTATTSSPRRRSTWIHSWPIAPAPTTSTRPRGTEPAARSTQASGSTHTPS